ncbi:hypothetical protein [Exiguobacterium sp. s193]|uniref:hypothetical protein n=1 Tax=Exiguobacterium sp. s193 TaxID=2751207 RepID=UPI001BE7C81F|nr:hypothetical protein [Exiguobacterium sp. s193]
MNSEVLLNGLFALLGAGIGGGASIWATRIQLKKQDEQNKINDKKNEQLAKDAKEEKRVLTKNIIETFLINEINDNLEKILWLEPSLIEGYGSQSHKSVMTGFKYESHEFEQVKLKLMEITTVETLTVIKIYQMFYMLQNTQIDSSLSRFNEKEFNYIVEAYKLADDFVFTYFEKKLKHYGN